MADAIRTVIPTRIAERTTPVITFTVKGDGVAIPGANLTTFTLTLYKLGDLTAILNGRNKQDVLNVNGVTVDGAGKGQYIMAAADNAVLGTDDDEQHVALFEWTWAGGTRAGKHEIVLRIANLIGVP